LKNTDYKIYLWLSQNVSEIRRNLSDTPTIKVQDITRLDFINSKAMKHESVIAKADMMRYEIVFQFGGIYTDVDSISVRKFPSIFQQSFVSHIFAGWNNIQNAVFGMRKGSKFLKFVLESLKLNYEKTPEYQSRSVPKKTGPTFFTTMFVSQ